MQRQLVELAPIGVGTEIALQWGIDRVARGEHRQKPHEAPYKAALVKRHLLRHGIRAEHIAVDLPEVAAGQLQLRGGANAQGGVVSERHLQPVLHAVALNQNYLGNERRQRLRLDELS